MTLEIKDDMVYSTELDQWVFLDDYLQMIVNEAAEVMEHAATLKFVSATDAEGNHWKYPTIKTFTGDKAEKVCKALNESGIPAQVDLYEDDDGWPGQLRQIWSVTIPDMILKDLELPHYIEDSVYEWDSESKGYVKIDIPCSKELDNEWANESI